MWVKWPDIGYVSDLEPYLQVAQVVYTHATISDLCQISFKYVLKGYLNDVKLLKQMNENKEQNKLVDTGFTSTPISCDGSLITGVLVHI